MALSAHGLPELGPGAKQQDPKVVAIDPEFMADLLDGPLDALRYDIDYSALVSRQLRERLSERLNEQLGGAKPPAGQPASPQDQLRNQLRERLRGLLGR